MSKNKRSTNWTDAELRVVAKDFEEYYRKNPDKYQIISYFNEKKRLISRRTFYDKVKSNKHPILTEAYETVKDICIERIIDKGFTNSKAQALTIFLLKNISPKEYRDRQELDHSGELKFVPIEFVRAKNKKN
jgi:ADP-heptose:LPS heptosyltransferase